MTAVKRSSRTAGVLRAVVWSVVLIGAIGGFLYVRTVSNRAEPLTLLVQEMHSRSNQAQLWRKASLTLRRSARRIGAHTSAPVQAVMTILEQERDAALLEERRLSLTVSIEEFVASPLDVVMTPTNEAQATNVMWQLIARGIQSTVANYESGTQPLRLLVRREEAPRARRILEKLQAQGSVSHDQ